MATEKELEKQLRQIKKEVRELRTHNQFLLDRLEKGHERNAELRKQMMTMTFDDVLKTQKELAEYQAKIKKDQELLETFDKQTEVKLDTQGITDGNTIRENQQTR
jgi:chromosome segregation ATPase|tara:strand:- start:64 stop:378 length:315 start_codon:yes stop_codon:yes gene_type:complete